MVQPCGLSRTQRMQQSDTWRARNRPKCRCKTLSLAGLNSGRFQFGQVASGQLGGRHANIYNFTPTLFSLDHCRYPRPRVVDLSIGGIKIHGQGKWVLKPNKRQLICVGFFSSFYKTYYLILLMAWNESLARPVPPVRPGRCLSHGVSTSRLKHLAQKCRPPPFKAEKVSVMHALGIRTFRWLGRTDSAEKGAARPASLSPLAPQAVACVRNG